MTTQAYCQRLLNEVERAGGDPQLAYLVRTRLRRALLALERGRRESPGGLLADAPPEIRRLTTRLGSRVTSLCQPSEALDVRWKREWSDLLEEVEHLRQWIQCSPAAERGA